jgi:hypothetical protein
MTEWQQALPYADEKGGTHCARAVTLPYHGQTEHAMDEVQRLKGTPVDPEDCAVDQSACAYSLASSAVRNGLRRPRPERDRLAEPNAVRATR